MIDIQKLIRVYGSSDPFELIKLLGVGLINEPLPVDTLGLTVSSYDESTIVINSHASEGEQLFIAAHELAHALLHSDESTTFYRKYTSGTQIPQIEAQAHSFALELIMTNFKNQSGDCLNLYDMLHYLGLPDSFDRFVKITQ